MKNILRAFVVLLGLSVFSVYGIEGKKARDVVVPVFMNQISNEFPTGEIVGNGSGVIIAPGFMITAAHVVVEDEGVTLVSRFPNRNDLIPLTVVKVDRVNDIALLSGNFKCPCAKISATIPMPDTATYVVGYPFMQTVVIQIFNSGIFQGISESQYLTTNQVGPGASGGGLFIHENDQYYLIGIIDRIPVYHNQLQTWLTFNVTNRAIIAFLAGTPVFRYLT
jgi:hypothetical protein